MRKLALIGTALAVATGLTATAARAQTNEINFGIISTEASSQPQDRSGSPSSKRWPRGPASRSTASMPPTMPA